MDHTQLLEEASVAIRRVYNDTSVPKQETIDSLKEISSELEDWIGTLEQEMEDKVADEVA